MEEFRAAASLLARRAAGRPSFEPVFLPLRAPAEAAQRAPGDASRQGPPCIAVDGSHAVLADNGSVWVVAHRAAAVAWPGPRPVEPPPVVTAVLAADAQESVDAAYAAVGTPAPRVRGADALGDALSSLAEFGAARSAIRAAPAGSLLLWDGALVGLPQHAQALADFLVAEARQHSVSLVAVAKRSALADGVPLVPWLQQHGPTGTWAVAVPGQPGTFVARLHARASHAFRVDATTVEDVGRLLPMSRDAVYVGYPYPLARVHNLVALTGGRVAELKGRLDGALRQAGPGALAFTQDFHAVLDRSVPG